MINSVTAVCVVYNTKDLIQIAYESFRRFYPEVPMLIIDGSDDDSREYVIGLIDPNLGLVLTENKGHGPGLHTGMTKAETDYVYLMDSDTEMSRPGMLEEMIRIMESLRAYGIGKIMGVTPSGKNIPYGAPECVRYLHPAVCIIDRLGYGNYTKFGHHGAPLIGAMKDIKTRGEADKILIDFPVDDYVHHSWRGTRDKHEIHLPWEDL